MYSKAVDNGVITIVEPPAGYIVNFDHPQQQYQIHVYALSGIGMVIAFLFLLQNVYVSLTLERKFRWEIACPIVAWMASVVIQGLFLHMFVIHAAGVHLWEMSIDKLNLFTECMVITPILYTIETSATKLSLMLSFQKLSPQTWWVWAVRSVIGLVIGYNGAIFFALIFGCTPIERGWNIMITEGSCINQTALYIATAALGAATDLIILIMPIPMVFGLRMARSQKIGLIFMFALGSATFITSVIRLILLILPDYNIEDQTWVISYVMIWAVVELNLLVICATLPTLRRFFHHVCPRSIPGTQPSPIGYVRSDSHRRRMHTFGSAGTR